jgi:hypothetical protein
MPNLTTIPNEAKFTYLKKRAKGGNQVLVMARGISKR